jgi:hypothetical protein
MHAFLNLWRPSSLAPAREGPFLRLASWLGSPPFDGQFSHNQSHAHLRSSTTLPWEYNEYRVYQTIWISEETIRHVMSQSVASEDEVYVNFSTLLIFKKRRIYIVSTLSISLQESMDRSTQYTFFFFLKQVCFWQLKKSKYMVFAPITMRVQYSWAYILARPAGRRGWSSVPKHPSSIHVTYIRRSWSIDQGRERR